MICDLPELWEFLTYYVFKYHMNVTEGLKVFPGDRIKVVKEEAGISTFNQMYDKIHVKQFKLVTRQIM